MRCLPRICVVLGLAIMGVACGAPRPRVDAAPPTDPLEQAPPEQLFQTGLVLASRGSLVRAEQYIAASIDRGYPEERGLPVLLRVCIASSRYGMALSYAEPYLRRNPNAWALRFLVASVYLGMGHPERAVSELETVIQLAPDEAAPHYLLGALLRSELDDGTDRATQHLRRYLELAPDGPHAQEVAHLLTRTGAVPPTASEPSPEPEEMTP